MSDVRPPSGEQSPVAASRNGSSTHPAKRRTNRVALLLQLGRPAPVAFIVFLLGLAVTLFAWRIVDVRENRLVAERFEALARQVLSEIQRHQGVHEQALRGGAALLSVVGKGTAAQWRSAYDNLRIAQLLPGVQGYGFAEAVTPARRAEHVARVRENGFPNYDVSPRGERPFYTPIAYLEPFDWRNQRAHGYDMFADPERRRAMTRAAETGATAATGRVRLVQEIDTDVQPGFLIYVPVYGPSAGDAQEDHPFPGLIGFVYSPVRVADFFSAILRVIQPDVSRLAAIEVFDGNDTAPEAMIFSSGDRDQLVGLRGVERTHDLFGRAWTIRMSPQQPFLDTVDRRARSEMLFGGLALSLMAGALAGLVAQRQRQREEAALRNDMVAREMSHRVKNLLAVIQSIAARTLTGGRTLQEARTVFGDRLAALARAHSALVDGQWSGASLRDLLEGELAPFGARVSMHGPNLRINSQMAQNMAMAVHELATNAVKYGALSESGGVVRLEWGVSQAQAGPVFSFSWQESGGPPAMQPEREGFGQTLLRRLIGASIGAEPITEYSRAGFCYSFACPLDRVAAEPDEERPR